LIAEAFPFADFVKSFKKKAENLLLST